MNMIDRNLNYGRDLIESFLRSSAGFESVLDIGAGSGSDLALAKKVNPKARLIGVELFGESQQRLRNFGAEVLPIDIEHGRLPLPDQSIDVVIANQVLEHLKEIFWVFHEVFRVLKVGGHFIIGVPNLAAFHNRLLLLAGKQPSPLKNYSAHVRGYTKGDLEMFLQNCIPGGANIIRCEGANFYPFPPVLARPLARLFPTMAWGIFLLVEKTKPYSQNEFLRYPVKERLETNFFLGGDQESSISL